MSKNTQSETQTLEVHQEIPKLEIFSQQDLQKYEKTRLSILTLPLKFLVISTSLVLLGKKMNLRRLLANPLKEEETFLKSDKYWKYTIYNAIFLGTGCSVLAAIYQKEGYLLTLFQQYNTNVMLFSKWKMQQQLKNYIQSQ